MNDPNFRPWLRKVWEEITRIGFSDVAPLSPFIDAAVPYEMGLSPEEAARALLNLDKGAYNRIVQKAKEKINGKDLASP